MMMRTRRVMLVLTLCAALYAGSQVLAARTTAAMQCSQSEVEECGSVCGWCWEPGVGYVPCADLECSPVYWCQCWP